MRIATGAAEPHSHERRSRLRAEHLNRLRHVDGHRRGRVVAVGPPRRVPVTREIDARPSGRSSASATVSHVCAFCAPPCRSTSSGVGIAPHERADDSPVTDVDGPSLDTRCARPREPGFRRGASQERELVVPMRRPWARSFPSCGTSESSHERMRRSGVSSACLGRSRGSRRRRRSGTRPAFCPQYRDAPVTDPDPDPVPALSRILQRLHRRRQPALPRMRRRPASAASAFGTFVPTTTASCAPR